MTLRTRSILSPGVPGEGLRISVMSRHTLGDGVTPHPDIGRETYDAHWQILAPPAKLIGDFCKRGLAWEEFAVRFAEHLCGTAVQDAVFRLLALAVDGNVVLLCVEDTPHRCHRRLLAEECLRLKPDLAVRIG